MHNKLHVENSKIQAHKNGDVHLKMKTLLNAYPKLNFPAALHRTLTDTILRTMLQTNGLRVQEQ